MASKRGEVEALALRVARLLNGAFDIGDEYTYGDFINDLRDGGFAGYKVGVGQARDVWSRALVLAEAE